MSPTHESSSITNFVQLQNANFVGKHGSYTWIWCLFTKSFDKTISYQIVCISNLKGPHISLRVENLIAIQKSGLIEILWSNVDRWETATENDQSQKFTFSSKEIQQKEEETKFVQESLSLFILFA